MSSIAFLPFETIEQLPADSLSPPLFDDRLKCWILARPDDVLPAMREANSGMPPLASLIDAAETRFSLDLSHLRYASATNALLIDGPVHAEARRELATLLAARRPAIAEYLADWIEELFAPLRSAPKMDLIEQVLLPLSNRMVTMIAGFDREVTFPLLSATRIFDRFSSLAAMRTANTEIGRLRDEIASQGREKDERVLLAVLMLGRDSLVGSLGSSLSLIFRRALAEKTPPGFTAPYPSTGIAASERMLTCPAHIGGHDFSEGAHLRLYFQPLNEHESGNLPIFGAGPHACLGRQIALDIWDAIAAFMSRLDRTVTSVQTDYFRSNIFCMPSRLEIELS